MIRYEFDAPVPAAAIADLRASVGWNRMEHALQNPKLCNAFHLCAFAGEQLIGYVAVVSNGVTDAYIQDLLVHPAHQQQGIGRQLMEQVIQHLRADEIYMVSVIYGEPELRSYYEGFGFTTMLCGQMELRPEQN